MRIPLSFVLLFSAFSVVHSAELPDTKPLTTDGDLAKNMVDGIHKYLDRELAAAPAKRDELWKAKADEPLAVKRERLRKMLGIVDVRLPRKVESYGEFRTSGRITPTADMNIYRVRWDVLPGLQAEGLSIEGHGNKYIATVIAIPGAGQTAEQLAGVDSRGSDSFAETLARRGCDVFIPSFLDRTDTHSGNARMNRFTNYTHREFVHRMAYEMGRTVTGFEVQQVLALLPTEKSTVPVAVIGFGDGGRVAMYAAALDERIAVCQVSGAFGPQEKLWKQPIDRNVWGLLQEFGDAEVASLIAPRKLIIEAMPIPKWDGPTIAKNGRSGAAPGTLEPYTDVEVESEIQRIPKRLQSSVKLHKNTGKHVDCEHFLKQLGAKSKHKTGHTSDAVREVQGRDSNPTDNPDIVQKRLLDRQVNFSQTADAVREIQGAVSNPADKPEVVQKRLLDRQVSFSQNLWRHSEPVRKEFWKKADATSLEKWEASCESYRNYFHEEAIGKLPEPTMPLNPRTRQIYDTAKWTGYEVVLDVYDDVFAYGIILLPKDMKPGEKRPVVVCQHGLEGRPTDVCNPKERTKYYNSYAAQLADRGYIVFAPQNPYIFDTHFRQIMRKANPLKLSLFSFIIRQHQRIIDWLETQPNVDSKRIAFYGLSYGGKTAMRVPAVEKRYCLSICSGDFNEWIGKIVSTELPMGYMFTKEYDMLEFDLGHTFNYAEMANLIAPRPFMVERGHDDGVGIDEMIAYEFAKVRYLYENKLKIGDRTELEFFVGGHEIHGKGTFAFLDRHLNWKPK